MRRSRDVHGVRRGAGGAVCAALLLSGVSLPAPAVQARQADGTEATAGDIACGGAQASRRWLGPGGVPLPFRNDGEIKDFLRTAEVVATRPLPVGVTHPLRVTLEREGVRADAVFRHFETVYTMHRMADGRVYANFMDSFRFEAAAYEIACLLGMDNVPPTVRRRIGRRVGSLQMWVYDARMESERAAQGLTPPDGRAWIRQLQQMLLFDSLIGNVDRNAGNLLIDRRFKVWLVDHTRAFYARAKHHGDRLGDLLFVERDTLRRLRALDRDRLQRVAGDYLSGVRMQQLLDRRDRLVDRIEQLIAERGADAVLYDAG